MNYEEIITEHLGWPNEVSAYVKKPDGSLKAADIRVDGACGLGKWLRLDGAKHEALPEYSKLKDAHAKYHQTTADIVGQADAGTLQESALGDKSEFKMSLVQFLQALMELRQKIL